MSMKFRSGKYAGKDIEYVRRVAPWYINWVRVNRPEMLKERTVKKERKDISNSSYSDSVWLRSIKPNLDFNNQTIELPERVVESEPTSNRYW